MAGWGGAEGPETPIAGKEEAVRGRAIGERASGDPPPCVTSLPSANFQATGRGREETLGCPGKLYRLRVVVPPLGQSMGVVPRNGQLGRPEDMLRDGAGTAAQAKSPPPPSSPHLLAPPRPSPGFCKLYCSASFGIPKAWRWGQLPPTSFMEQLRWLDLGGCGAHVGMEWSCRIEDMLRDSSGAPPFVQHEIMYCEGTVKTQGPLLGCFVGENTHL